MDSVSDRDSVNDDNRPSTSQTQSESPARKKARKWSCTFKAEWLENAWLSKKDDLTGECIVCRQTPSRCSPLKSRI